MANLVHLFVGAALFAIGCTPKPPAQDKHADASPSAFAEPPKPPIKLSAFADTKIEPGPSRMGSQIGTYRIQRSEGDTSKTFLEAAAMCMKTGRTLCTEAQWLRACDAHPAIGAMPSWTASWKESKAIVRGGGSCDLREKVDGLDRSATRVAFCCERAVSVRAEGKAGDEGERATQVLLRYESALNKGDLEALRGVLADEVVREKRLTKAEDLIEREKESAKTDPVLWTLYDACSVRPALVVVDIDADAGSGRVQGTLVDCLTIVARESGVVSFRTALGLFRSKGESTERIHEIRHRGSPLAPGAR